MDDQLRKFATEVIKYFSNEGRDAQDSAKMIGLANSVIQSSPDSTYLHIDQIRQLATIVFEYESDADAWMMRPHMLLDNMSPYDYIIETGDTEKVHQILGRLQFGTGV